MSVLTLLVFLPIALLPVYIWLPRVGWLRALTGLTALAQLGVLAALAPTFWAGGGLVTLHPWIDLHLGDALLKIRYELVMDGISYTLSLLSAGIMLIAVLASDHITHRPRLYWILLQLLNTSLIGCFLAQDMVLFYIFFEVMLLPMFFLIGIWGGARREYAAVKFFLYTLLGSLLLLLVIAGLVFSYPVMQGGVRTLQFSFSTFSNPGYLEAGSFFADGTVRTLAFWAMFLAFAIKLPAIPLHTWLPDAHVEASTPISVILAGVLLKVGGYGLLRFAIGIFPDVYLEQRHWIALLGGLSIVYGGLVALGQTHFKRQIAYSSVAHMGFVLLGLAAGNAVGAHGAVLQLFTHGLIAGMLFLVAGALYHRTGDLAIASYSGLWHQMPRFTLLAAVAMFAGMGLPGLAAFIPELLVLNGAFQAASTGVFAWVYPVLGIGGILLSAAYLLWTFRRMFMGEYRTAGGQAWALPDLNRTEWLTLSLPGIAIVLLGIWPGLILDLSGPAVEAFFRQVHAHAATYLSFSQP
ncbi:MAG: NADH-quinone oxidoreductase subunit M [Bacteroidetes bacterium]|nr:NADH-quinone oxidoreductase subunit M [Bacteroidota bacterium]